MAELQQRFIAASAAASPQRTNAIFLSRDAANAKLHPCLVRFQNGTREGDRCPTIRSEGIHRMNNTDMVALHYVYWKAVAGRQS